MLTSVVAALVVSTSPAVPEDGEPVFVAQLEPMRLLAAEVPASRGYETYLDVRRVVSGSVCTGLGAVFGGLGAYGLLSAIPLTGSSRTVATVLGWTSLGFGIVLGAVGIPLLIVGIVGLARPRAEVRVSESGMLAVAF